MSRSLRFVRKIRYDLFTWVFIAVVLLWYFLPMLVRGQIMADAAEVPRDTSRYLAEVSGLGESRVNAESLSNLRFLAHTILPWIMSAISGFSGAVLFKSHLVIVVFASAITMYAFVRRLFDVFRPGAPDLVRTFALSAAPILYVLNPWFVLRTEEIYLLSAYSLLPLLFLLVLQVFSPAFQRGVGYTILRGRVRHDALANGAPRSTLRRLGRRLDDRRGRLRSRGIGFSPRSVTEIAGLGLVLSLVTVAPAYAAIAAAVSFAVIAVEMSRGRVTASTAMGVTAKCALVLLFFFGFSAYWLLPNLAGGASALSRTGVPDLETLTAMSRNGTLVKVLMLVSQRATVPVTAPFIAGFSVVFVVILVGAIRHRRALIILALSLAMLLTLLATGTNSERVAPMFIRLARSNAGVVTPHIADPNSLLGFLNVVYGVLFALGVGSILFLALKSRLATLIVRLLTILCGIAAVALFSQPIMATQIERLDSVLSDGDAIRSLNPGRIGDMGQDTESGGGAGTRYLALSDDEALSDSESAPETWDRGATLMPARNHLQEYYLDYLSYLMKTGSTRDLPVYLSALDIDAVLHSHSPPAEAEFRKEMLEIQRGWASVVEEGDLAIFRRDAVMAGALVHPVVVHSAGGFAGRAALSVLTSLDNHLFSYIFSHAEPGPSIHLVREGDLIAADSFDDLWLANLGEAHYLDPSQSVSDGNPFLGWSAMRLHSAAWQSLIRDQGVVPLPFDFDMGHGVAVTFASTRPSVPSFRRDNLNGPTVMDADAMRRLGIFFESAAPDRHIVYSYDSATQHEFVPIRTRVATGATAAEVVATSGMIEANISTPYRFDLAISGENVDKSILGIRFFDSAGRTVGPVIRLAPSDRVESDYLGVFGEITSPPDARYLRFQILSLPPAESKTTWWIHDFHVRDLSAYREANDFRLEFEALEEEPYRFYARVLFSPRGGELAISAAGSQFTLDTRTSTESRFGWIEVGEVEIAAGRNSIEIRNVSGMNALNRIAAIPRRRYDESRFPVDRAIEKGALFFSLEAEHSFEVTAHTQTTRRYPDLSLGNGIAAADGRLKKRVDILKSGSYHMILHAAGDRNRSQITARITNRSSAEAYTREASLRAVLPSVAFRSSVFESNGGRRLATHDGALPDLQLITLEAIELSEGEYDLELEMRSTASNLATVFEMQAFDPRSLATGSIAIGDAPIGCASCESVDASMMRHSFANGIITISFDPGCSCDSYVYSTESVGVVGNDEYLVRFDARSSLLQNRHVKLLYLDNRGRLIGTERIGETVRSSQSDWNHYEHVATIPNAANQMLIQLWGRGDRTRTAEAQMRDLSVLPYRDLPMIDVVYLLHEEAMFVVDGRSDAPIEVEVDVSNDQLRRRLRSSALGVEETLVEFNLAPSPIWRIGSRDSTAVAINGVSLGVFTEEREIELTARGRRAYYLGIVLFFLTIPVGYATLLAVGTPAPFGRLLRSAFVVRLRRRLSLTGGFRGRAPPSAE